MARPLHILWPRICESLSLNITMTVSGMGQPLSVVEGVTEWKIMTYL